MVVALDGMTQTLSAVSDIRSAFEEAGRSEGTGAMTYSLVNAPDLLDELWEDRPAYPQSPIITLSAELAGESRQERIAWLRSEMEAKKCSAILLTALDEIVWMLNVRGSDVNYNPVIYSYLLVTQDKVQWYVVKNSHVAPDGETAASFDELRKDAVDVLPYSDVEMGIAALEGKRLWADPGTLNYNLYNVIMANLGQEGLQLAKSPVPLRKSIKNPTEIKGFIEANIEEGIALERFFYWLEHQLSAGETVTEWEASETLTS